MRSALLIALVLIAGCAQSGADLFKKVPLPDAPPDAMVHPDATVDAPVDAAVDASIDAGDAGPQDAAVDAN